MLRNRNVALYTCVLMALVGGCYEGPLFQLNGQVFNGATGDVVTDYTIDIVAGSQTFKGKVDDGGRYTIGDIPQSSDFTVTIVATGYRRFFSTNTALTGGTNAFVTKRNFDATLFPDTLVTPAATVRVVLSDSDAKPSGTARFRGTAASTLLVPFEGIPNQSFDNDADTLVSTITIQFTDGVINIPEGTLVYGVAYTITIYGVDGYAIGTGSFVAGTNVDASITLTPQTSGGSNVISVVFASTNTSDLNASGTLTIIFNKPVEFDPTATEAFYEQGVNNSLIVTLSDGTNAISAMPVSDPAPTTPYLIPNRNINLALSPTGETLTVTWGGNAVVQNLAGPPAVTVRSVTYDLSGVTLRGANNTAPFIGTNPLNSYTVNVSAQTPAP